jgi:hypothetical protein
MRAKHRAQCSRNIDKYRRFTVAGRWRKSRDRTKTERRFRRQIRAAAHGINRSLHLFRVDNVRCLWPRFCGGPLRAIRTRKYGRTRLQQARRRGHASYGSLAENADPGIRRLSAFFMASESLRGKAGIRSMQDVGFTRKRIHWQSRVRQGQWPQRPIT